MANGIGNKKIGNKPAGQNEKSLACIARLAKTEKGLDLIGQAIRGCKEQIQRGEYVSIKLSDKPLQIRRDDNEMTI